jgi:hypothetical protein
MVEGTAGKHLSSPYIRWFLRHPLSSSFAFFGVR